MIVLSLDAQIILVTIFAFDEAFLSHDLQQLQDRCIAEGARRVDFLKEVANGRRAAVPENAEQFKLAFSGPRKGCVSLHVSEGIRRRS